MACTTPRHLGKGNRGTMMDSLDNLHTHTHTHTHTGTVPWRRPNRVYPHVWWSSCWMLNYTSQNALQRFVTAFHNATSTKSHSVFVIKLSQCGVGKECPATILHSNSHTFTQTVFVLTRAGSPACSVCLLLKWETHSHTMYSLKNKNLQGEWKTIYRLNINSNFSMWFCYF